MAFSQPHVIEVADIDGDGRKDNALDVSAYSADMPDQRLAGSIDYPSPRPDIWKEPHLKAVRQYRIQECHDREERRRVRRAPQRIDAQVTNR